MPSIARVGNARESIVATTWTIFTLPRCASVLVEIRKTDGTKGSGRISWSTDATPTDYVTLDEGDSAVMARDPVGKLQVYADAAGFVELLLE